MTPLIVPSLVCLAAATALGYALRGRRVGNHPVCRKCGFDLIGKPAGSTVCSECGAHLSRPRAVRVGARERRRGLAGVAALMLMACLAWLGFVTCRVARDTDWNRHKPVWWLMREARGSRVALRDAAFAELSDRMTSGKLPPDGEAALIDAALDVQADRGRSWTAAVGDVITRAANAGKLSNERWQRYAWQAAPVELVARPVVRRGDPVVFALVIPPSRLAAGQAFKLEYESKQVRVGEVVSSTRAPAGVVGARGGRYLAAGDGGSRETLEIPEAGNTLAALREGKHTLRLSLRLEMYDWSTPRQPPGSPPGPPMQFDQPRELSAQVKVVAKDAITVALVSDPSLRAAVQKSISGRLAARDDGFLIQFDATCPPIDLAFDVVARHGSREWKLGHVRCPAGRSDSPGFAEYYQYLGTPAELDPDSPLAPGNQAGAVRVDLLLRPSIEQAVRTPDMTRIWGGEIVYRDVNLHRGVGESPYRVRVLTPVGGQAPALAPPATQPRLCPFCSSPPPLPPRPRPRWRSHCAGIAWMTTPSAGGAGSICSASLSDPPSAPNAGATCRARGPCGAGAGSGAAGSWPSRRRCL